MVYNNERNATLSDMTVSHYVQSVNAYNNSLYSRGFCTGGKCPLPGAMNATQCQGLADILFCYLPHYTGLAATTLVTCLTAVEFKLAAPVYKALNDLAPPCLSEIIAS